MLPRGARSIVEARLKGLRPADPVVVSFVGSVPWDNPTVYADAGASYDWRFLLGLPVMVVVKRGVQARDSLHAIFEMAGLYPTLVDIEAKKAASVITAKPLRLLAFPKHHPGWQELFA